MSWRSSARWTSTSKPTRTPASRAADAGAGPGAQAADVVVLEVELDRRPAGDRVGIRQRRQDVLRAGLRCRVCGPCPHVSNAHRLGAGASSAPVTIRASQFEDPAVVLEDDARSSAGTMRLRHYLCHTVSIRLPDLRARAGAWPPYRLDAVLGALLFVETMVEAALRRRVDRRRASPWSARRRSWRPAWRCAAARRGGRQRARRRGRRARQPAAGAVAGRAAGRLLRRGCSSPTRWPRTRRAAAADRHRDQRSAASSRRRRSSTAIRDVTDFLGAIVLFIVGPVLAGRLLHSRLHLNRALREKAERRRARAPQPRRGGGRWTSAPGSRASCTTSSPTRSAP